ncbi:hypothetical protein VPH35_018033 [Triticum aestivum]
MAEYEKTKQLAEYSGAAKVIAALASSSYPQFDRENFGVWKALMECGLRANELWDAVDPGGDAFKKEGAEHRKDRQAASAIYSVMPMYVLQHLIAKATAKEVWDTLKLMLEGHTRVKEANLQTLLRNYETLVMGDDESVDAFASRVATLVNRIRALGENLTEALVVRRFLRAAPPRYLQIVTAIEQCVDLATLSIDDLVGRYKAHDERMRYSLRDGRNDELVMLTRAQWVALSKEKQGGSRSSSKKKGKQRSARKNFADSDKDSGDEAAPPPRGKFDIRKVRCYNCGLLGHFKANSEEAPKQKALMAQQGDESDMMLMCELVDKVDPVLQASAKEIVMLREEKVHYQDHGSETHVDDTDIGGDSEAYGDVTGISANFAGADAAIAACGRPWKSNLAADIDGNPRTYVDATAMVTSTMLGGYSARAPSEEAAGNTTEEGTEIEGKSNANARSDALLSRPKVQATGICVDGPETKDGRDPSATSCAPGSNNSILGTCVSGMPLCPSGPGAGGSRGGLSQPRQRWRPEWPEYGDEDAAAILCARGALASRGGHASNPRGATRGAWAGIFTMPKEMCKVENETSPRTAMEENAPTPTSILPQPVLHPYSEKILRTLDPVMEEKSGRRCLTSAKEPAEIKDANTKECWRRAMEAGLRLIHDNNAWELVDPPPNDNENAMDLKWEFKVKKDVEGCMKHKARFVAKEYVQGESMDFEEVFIPIAKMESVRLLIALAVQESWKVHHMDVKSAFLNSEIEGDVYVNQPLGFIKEGEEHKVLKLHKILYGLWQGPREWNVKLDRTLISLGFEKAPLEHAMYKRGEGKDRLLVGIYVDDLLITGADEEVIAKFKLQMKELFKMDDLSLLSYYPGIEVHQKTEGVTLCQEAYARKILESYGMKDCNPNDSPMKPRLELSKKSKVTVVDAIEYIAAAAAACQGVWLGRLHGDLLDRDPEQVVLNVDSKSESFLREDPVRHDRSKHIDTVYHYIKDCVEEG